MQKMDCQMNTKFELRYGHHPADVKGYDTEKLRREFIIDKLFTVNKICMTYSIEDRFVIGGVLPNEPIELDTFDHLKSDYFLQRREIGIINIGNTGMVEADGQEFILNHKDALYIGRGVKTVIFSSVDTSKPAKFYFNSSMAHKEYETKKVEFQDAIVVEAGSPENSNARKINKLIVNEIVQTCQLQMGLTELKPGSIWNTMPAHNHPRRNEVYFYFEVASDQSVCHFMGETAETRHLWLKNEQAVISPVWSIHSGAGTSNYYFIWGMAGENLDYSDMEICKIPDLK